MKKHKYLIITIVWMAVIFVFSSQTGNESNLNNQFLVNVIKALGLDKIASLSNINFIIRKAAHFSEYFILGVLLYNTAKAYFYSFQSVLSGVIGFLYACSDEFHQRFVSGRGPSFHDVVIDTSGVLFALLIIALCCLHQKKFCFSKKRHNIFKINF